MGHGQMLFPKIPVNRMLPHIEINAALEWPGFAKRWGRNRKWQLLIQAEKFSKRLMLKYPTDTTLELQPSISGKFFGHTFIVHKFKIGSTSRK